MKIKNICIALIFCLLSIMLLVGCQSEAPVPTPTPSVHTDSPAQTVEPKGQSITGESIYSVSSVEEFLSVIGNNRVISLEAGVYDLSTAVGYGTDSGENWYWQEAFDGYELVISGVSGLRICGNISGKTEILTQPRYADVISFESCDGITLQHLTLGHSPEPGLCAGGVIYLRACEDVKIENSYLFGCGIIALQAENSKSVRISESHLYDCSQQAVQLHACNDVRIEDSKIHNNGENYYGALFQVENSRGFAIVNCDIYENRARSLIGSNYSQQVSILGCGVRDNYFEQSLFDASGYSPVADKCQFNANGEAVCFSDLPAVDLQGNVHTRDSLQGMERSEAQYDGPMAAADVELEESRSAEGLREVRVKTVDEFLAAIGSDTVIKLEGEIFKLSDATDYGAYGTDYYYWHDMFDGPGLVISGVRNLSIIAENDCTIAAIPRYADVLRFVNCENITLSGFTAGHTEEPGECAGGVLSFENCWDIDIADCRLFGCGIMGIDAYCCSELDVKNTEIYDCSQGAIALYTVMDANFEDMNIHDCMTPEIGLHDCVDILYEGEPLGAGAFFIRDGKAVQSISN